jgi:hypothetical protein
MAIRNTAATREGEKLNLLNLSNVRIKLPLLRIHHRRWMVMVYSRPAIFGNITRCAKAEDGVRQKNTTNGRRT